MCDRLVPALIGIGNLGMTYTIKRTRMDSIENSIFVALRAPHSDRPRANSLDNAVFAVETAALHTPDVDDNAPAVMPAGRVFCCNISSFADSSIIAKAKKEAASFTFVTTFVYLLGFLCANADNQHVNRQPDRRRLCCIDTTGDTDKRGQQYATR
jgi:hypothetical protein